MSRSFKLAARKALNAALTTLAKGRQRRICFQLLSNADRIGCPEKKKLGVFGVEETLEKHGGDFEAKN